jgi:hypothetical protein
MAGPIPFGNGAAGEPRRIAWLRGERKRRPFLASLWALRTHALVTPHAAAQYPPGPPDIASMALVIVFSLWRSTVLLVLYCA